MYDGEAVQHGNHWENGNNNDNGLFRMGYPFVPVSLSDLKHHQPECRPAKAEEPQPSVGDRHPHARRTLRAVTLPGDLRGFVSSAYRSPCHRYWGLTLECEAHLLLNAGWTGTVNDPYDLRASELRCKCFCHFGCSTRIHNWAVVRSSDYKGWVRPDPPTDHFAYFTSAPADSQLLPMWPKY